MKNHPKSRLMQALELIEKEIIEREVSGIPLSLGDLVLLLGELGHSILILILCLMFLQPIPLPGISTPIGAIVVILATLQFMNKAPWIPKRFRGRAVPLKALFRIAELCRKIWSKLEKFLRPRLFVLNRSRAFRFVNLVIIIASACLLALPLPIPFTNTVPAFVIIALSFAHLEDDGLLVLVGYAASIAMVFFFLSLGAGVINVLERPWASYF
ncbi:MAG: exopolysaccharide biosynthesis protein [Proteobacteria bacterium]|nr:MAG: exopolysaccharide biosynthesis protein [Pseudomonadota bacterium]